MSYRREISLKWKIKPKCGAFVILQPFLIFKEFEKCTNFFIAGAVLLHFASLASWFWILVYWILVLVMLRRPVGGHISHFFIKAAIPSYLVPLVITTACLVAAHANGEMKDAYYGRV